MRDSTALMLLLFGSASAKALLVAGHQAEEAYPYGHAPRTYLVISFGTSSADRSWFGAIDRVVLPALSPRSVGRRPVLPHERRFLRLSRYGNTPNYERAAAVHFMPPRSLGRKGYGE